MIGKRKVIKMVEYVRGSPRDSWHWCNNCTQYPLYIHQKTNEEPFSNLCEQCKRKAENGICQNEETKITTPEPRLRSAFQ
jgi:hypothetical protein